jgi:hypothetical protein
MIVNIKSVVKGSNTDVSPLIHPLEQPKMMLGCSNTWKIGATTKDTGYELVANQPEANKPIRSLYHFRQVPGTEKMLATVDNAASNKTQLFYRANGAGNWTAVAAAESAWNLAGQAVEMESFIGYCFFVGYGASGFLPVGSLTGTTFSTATNVTDMPKAKYIVRYDGQLFVANCHYGGTYYPFRIVKSSYPSAGAITWTPATDFLDVDYSDEITGLTTAWKKLIAFTEYKMWVYDGSTWNDPYEYGCSAHRTIKKHGAYLIWCNTDGVWVSTGGQPQNISGEIYSFFKAANPRNLFAEIVDEQYVLYLGNVTVDGVSYANLVASFDIGKSIWYFRELYDTMTAFGKYNDAGKMRLYMGTSLGYICNKGKYTDSTVLTSDRGNDINSSIELAPFHLDTIDKFKKLNAIVAYSDRPGGLHLKAKVLDNAARVLSPYMPIGELTKYINSFDVDIDSGVMIQVMLTENGKNPYWSFLGLGLDVVLDGKIPK